MPVFSAVKPLSTSPPAVSTSSSSVSPLGPLAYSLTRSWQRPPRSSYTGKPATLPLMSQSACSMALIAEKVTAPPRKNGCRYITCQSCWMRAGSSPTTYSLNSSTAAATARGWPGRLPSPTPLTPSSVSTRTKSQLRDPTSTMSGSSELIFTRLALLLERVFQQRSQILLGLAQVLAHGLRGLLRVPRSHGVQNRLVLLDHVLDSAAASLVAREGTLPARAQWLGEGLDQEDEQPVAGGSGEILVEADVRSVEGLELLSGAHRRDGELHVGEVALRGAAGREGVDVHPYRPAPL